MKNYCQIQGFFAVVSGLVITVQAATAQTIIIESRSAGKNFGYYHEGTGNWADSTAKATQADGVTAGIGSRFATANGATFSVNPVLEDGQMYVVDITHGTSSNIPTDLTNSVTVTGGTGLPATTTVFSQKPDNVWERIGILTLDAGVTQPTVTFTKLAGASGTGQRLYADAVRFTKYDPCFGALPQLITVNGPLAAGQTFVDVPGVASTATAVSVYGDGILLGRKTSGVAAGVNRVTTSPLAKGQVITATQNDTSGVESCKTSSGPIVGGGPNPTVRIALSIRQNPLLTGPIGAAGPTTNADIKFLGATGVVNNVNGNAPAGTRVLIPGSDWQTVQFLRGPDPANPTDPTYRWNVGTEVTTPPNELKGTFGVLDAIAFAVDGGDAGPYGIYIDSFMNGSTLIQGFEGTAPGGQAGFLQPSFSGTTANLLLSPAPGTVSPNISMVTNNTADEGSHCLYVSWQFKDTNQLNWMRFVAQGAGSPNPMLDLSQPITFRMLILPPGQEPPQSAPVFSQGPADQTVLRGGTATMRVNVRGTPTLRYQWLFNGSDLTGRTNSTLTVTNVQAANVGRYSVRVSNSLGSTVSSEGVLSMEDVPYTDVMTPMWRIAIGARAYLANDNATRSIAYNPLSGNLLLASRTGSNAIHVLNGDTGAYRHTMPAPLNGFAGGTFALNMVAVADDGSVYAANLTEDGATNNLKIYKFLDDTPEGGGAVVWEGNPSGDPDIHARWGDTMVVHGTSGDHELIFSSRDGAYLSSIRPDFGPSAPPVVMDVTGAASGNMRIGLAVAGADALWGKQIGLPLIHVAMDPNRFSASVDRSYSTVGNMSAIGFDPVNNLIAGVFVETPDNLRLFDASNPAGLVPLDTELFPTDNANGNASGAVAFGPDRVYALDSNNGIIAMNLSLACLPDMLHIERSGGNVIVSWSRPSSRLQATSDFNGQNTIWSDIPGSSPVPVPADGGKMFFRLICP